MVDIATSVDRTFYSSADTTVHSFREQVNIM